MAQKSSETTDSQKKWPKPTPRWQIIAQPEDASAITLARKLNNISPTLAKVLIQRGIDSYDKAVSYFKPNLSDLHDPFLMQDMPEAVARIIKAMDTGENILIYGDYDVDGTTSVAVMSSFLEGIYDHVTSYIPDRYKEGYGISIAGIDYAADNDISLIIALDCGIKAVDKVAYADGKGIDFIICDHHTPGDKLPEAVAILDPKRKDCNYPYKELCGCGVGFKLCDALTKTLDLEPQQLYRHIDLVAIAIGADIVQMTGENRILAYHGLKLLNSHLRPGLKAMLGDRKTGTLSIHQVVFQIAPRINAAGRMDHGLRAVNLLKETDVNRAKEMAAEIEIFNSDRRDADRQITQEALLQIEELGDQDRVTTVVASENWHKGVIGIVASRLIEHFYRPTLVFTGKGNRMAASARSVNGFSIYDALLNCSDLIEQFGGHAAAAGLTLLPENYDAFKAKFEKVVRDTIDPKLLTPTQRVDARLDLQEIDARFLKIVELMGPFGPGNMRPVFISEGVTDTGYGKAVGKNGTHLKLTVCRSEDKRRSLSAIGFNLGDRMSELKAAGCFDIAYVIEANEWQGQVNVQLNIKAVRI